MRALKHSIWTLVLAFGLAACGGGGGGGGSTTPAPAPTPTPPAGLDVGNDTAFQKVLSAQPANPAASAPSGGTATTLTIHYRRPAGDYTGWTLHHWNAAVETSWTAGQVPNSTDAFGAVFNVPLAAQTGTVGYIFHNGDTKDHGGADQSYVLKAGANEIWRIQGDNSTYTSNPLGSAAPDIATLRVHYKRFDGNFPAWGLHLWDGSGLTQPSCRPA